MFFHSKKGFLLHSVWPETEHNWGLIWKKSLLIRFESLLILAQAEYAEGGEHLPNG